MRKNVCADGVLFAVLSLLDCRETAFPASESLSSGTIKKHGSLHDEDSQFHAAHQLRCPQASHRIQKTARSTKHNQQKHNSRVSCWIGVLTWFWVCLFDGVLRDEFTRTLSLDFLSWLEKYGTLQ